MNYIFTIPPFFSCLQQWHDVAMNDMLYVNLVSRKLI